MSFTVVRDGYGGGQTGRLDAEQIQEAWKAVARSPRNDKVLLGDVGGTIIGQVPA